jgi:adenylate kinase
MKKIVVIIGKPYSGKTTHAKLLAKKLNYKYFSCGEFVSNEIKNETNFGLIAKKYFDAVTTIPDEYFIRVIKEKLINLTEEGIVLDKFPKTIAQAKSLDSFLFKRKTFKPIPIFLDIDQITVLNRMEKPITETPIESLNKLMGDYKTNAQCISDYYPSKLTFDTSKEDIETVSEKIMLKIKEYEY